ncbi:AAEL012128-PA [Aedes aegypti]|uniref:AAEL012128-PA n=1 Tax=Aedes aegypti TaxID=7159 RepID=Q16N03_AEDAE|nr:AAEL012128-PA [Aedes aegypti]
MDKFFKALCRKKPNDDDGSHSKLARVLTLLDLTGLGVGSTLGLGAYVLAGSVAYEQAGPGVVVSFVIAAVAAAIAGLCYAEFAARVPKAGSAYIYTYITIGEFAAFTIGWNLMLEYIIGTASVARGLSGYIDALIDHRMEKALQSIVEFRVSFLGKHPDIFSFFVVLTITALLAYGVKESTVLNNIFTGVNLMVIVVVLISVGTKVNPDNWNIKPEDIPEGVKGGVGGFMPYGLAGVMAGAAKCFYGYVGFDCIATTGEEARNPSRNIPLAIIFSLLIIFLSYFGVATVLTMALPYYNQDPKAPFPNLFNGLGWQEIKWIVSIALVTCIVSAILVNAQDYLSAQYPLNLTILTILAMSILILFLVIACQPTEESKITFKVPLVPFVPMLSILVNIYLMFQLDVNTWISFSIWLLVGFVIYFTYGIRHSVLGSGSQTLSESQLENPFCMVGLEKA